MVGVLIDYLPGSVAYVAAPGEQFQVDYVKNPPMGTELWSGAITSTTIETLTNTFGYFYNNNVSRAAADVINTPIYLQVTGPDPTAGDGTLFYAISYFTIPA